MSTADVIRQMLIDLNLVVEDPEADWQAFTGFLPNDPDSVICVYDTAGRKDGRVMKTGEQITHPGIQVMVRGRDYLETQGKSYAIALALDDQRKTVVSLESTGSYIVHNVSRTGDIISLGMEIEGDRRRHVFVINAIVTISKEEPEPLPVVIPPEDPPPVPIGPIGILVGNGAYQINEIRTSTGFYAVEVNGSITIYPNTAENIAHPAGSQLRFWSCASAVDSSQMGEVTHVQVPGSTITGIDVRNLLGLQLLNCPFNQLVILDVSGLPVLVELFCSSNQLTTLNVSDTPSLQLVDCLSNQLTTLDVSNTPSLVTLYCQNNELTTLDVSTTALASLDCSSNLFNSAAVDAIFITLNAFGTSDGGLVMSPNSLPGAAGLAAKAALQGRGWYVE